MKYFVSILIVLFSYNALANKDFVLVSCSVSSGGAWEVNATGCTQSPKMCLFSNAYCVEVTQWIMDTKFGGDLAKARAYRGPIIESDLKHFQTNLYCKPNADGTCPGPTDCEDQKAEVHGCTWDNILHGSYEKEATVDEDFKVNQ